MQRVPVELIESIAEESLCDDLATAKSISLVCRHLQQFGQRVAFRRLKLLISTGDDTGPLVEKLEGLVAHPTLLSHTKDFDLEVLGCDKDCITWMNQHVALLTSVLDLVQLGQPLLDLSISGQWGFRDWITYSEGAPEGGKFRKRLYEMVSIPTIQSLDLIAQPSIILHRRFPALKHLTTRFLSRSSPGRFRKSIDSPAGDGAAFGNPTILETLNIQSSGSGGNTWDAFDYLASESNTNIFLYSLKDLSFLCSHNLSWEGARKILDKCRGSLQTLTFKCHRLPGLGPHPNLEFFALPNLHRLTVMLPLKKYGASGSPISWLSSEIFSGAPFSTGKLENVVILIVLGLDQELEDYEAQDLARISETLANEDKFPYLRSVELVLCTWTGSFPPAEGMIRQKSRARPYVGSVEVLEAFRGVTDELARRGLDIFELRWEYHDTSPWDWY